MEPLSDVDTNEFDAERDQYLAKSFKKTSAIVDTEANKRKVSWLQHVSDNFTDESSVAV